jgi:hypothetical protein
MPPIKTAVVISKASGVIYASAAHGGNLGASSHASNYVVPAASAPIGDAKRPHLRLVRD